MRKIGLLSDTHGFLDPRIFEYFKDVDEIWHAGDVGSMEVIEKLEAFKPVKGVYGNIDGHEVRAAWPKTRRFLCEKMHVIITHIGGKPYVYSKDAYAEFIRNKPDVFVCGHSHILLVQFDKKINAMWINPGACGYKGFHKVKTILRFEVHGRDLKNMEAIELGPRVKGDEIIPDEFFK
ncbi:metallophosphatase family protein [Paracrocinitomix mangrovi]|uniref:metallophosphoesterase family protein n=1 Tax=Paracrocinitomix mangrovi TaxID=2862509 RepID=UPI001C8D4121|nr:metallophosphoesterase family protein [Paracrocinitomix mangrovi]UKN01383.1 metallophosphatase family protein [Paracrocinitomix mangrovi]